MLCIYSNFIWFYKLKHNLYHNNKTKKPKTTEYKFSFSLSFIIWQIQFCKGQITGKTGSRYITSKHFRNNIYGTIKCWQVNHSYYLWKPHKQLVFSVKCSWMSCFLSTDFYLLLCVQWFATRGNSSFCWYFWNLS